MMIINRMICKAGLGNNPNKPLKSISWICLHCTGNYASTATAKNHATYVNNGSGGSQASFHYAVDKDEIWQIFEDTQGCWHCGNATGNDTSIGIEVCVNDKAGFRQACLNAAWLVAELLKRHKLTIDKVVQHYNFSGKNCLPLDTTELLTPNGWMFLRDIRKDDIVAEYLPNSGNIRYTKVQSIVEPHITRVHKVSGFEASAKHRVIYWTMGSNGVQESFKVGSFSEVYTRVANAIIKQAGFKQSEGIPLTDDEIRLLVWIQADGHYQWNYAGGDKKKIYGVEFHLSKTRKVSRVMEILDNLGIEYRICQQSDKTIKIRTNYDVYKFSETWLDDKKFTAKFLEMTIQQYEIFVKELPLADGHIKGNGDIIYFSMKKENAEIVQILSVFNNTAAHIRQDKQHGLWWCNFPKDNHTIGKNIDRTVRQTKVGCVSVESGFIVIRQNGKPFITGNCPAELRSGAWGITWAQFLDMVKSNMDGSATPSTPTKYYRIQMGAYSVKSNAEAILIKIKAAGFADAFVTPLGADKLYRVQIGAYSVKANSDAMLAKVKAAGFSDAFVKYGD